MPSYPLRALVLRKTKLGEADLILTLLASDGRQVRAVAKGARKPRSRFGARSEPYHVLDLLLHTGRSLEIVAEARTVASHEGLRADLDRSAHAAVVAGVLEKVTVEGQADDRLYGLALAALDAVEDAPAAELLAVTDAFLVKVMAMLGYRPQLASCVSCGSDAPAGGFSLDEGGVVCEACSCRVPGVRPATRDALCTLAALLAARMSEVARLAIPQTVQRECFELLRAFAAAHVPARVRALDYLAGCLG